MLHATKSRGHFDLLGQKPHFVEIMNSCLIVRPQLANTCRCMYLPHSRSLSQCSYCNAQLNPNDEDLPNTVVYFQSAISLKRSTYCHPPV